MAKSGTAHFGRFPSQAHSPYGPHFSELATRQALSCQMTFPVPFQACPCDVYSKADDDARSYQLPP